VPSIPTPIRPNSFDLKELTYESKAYNFSKL